MKPMKQTATRTVAQGIAILLSYVDTVDEALVKASADQRPEHAAWIREAIKEHFRGNEMPVEPPYKEAA